MILNFYSILAGSVGLLRLALATALVLLGWLVWRQWRASSGPNELAAAQARAYLAFLIAFFLTGLNLASWPLLYMVLQSYVPEWPGVMCVYGVTRIGLGSDGISRHLPTLLQALQALKPALVFATGAWLVLYSVHRRSRTAWLLAPMLITLIGIGAGSALDAATELTYLVMPKKEVFLASGCCTATMASSAPVSAAGGSAAVPWISALYLVANVALVLALRQYRAPGEKRGFRTSLLPVLLAAAVAVPASAWFLIDVVTPQVLALPQHHCVYDLIPRAPHVVLGAAFFVWGTFSIGWAATAQRLADHRETQSFIHDFSAAILRRGEGGYVLSVVVLAYALATAKW